MANTRIYVVLDHGGTKKHRLVEATSAAQAIRHCARNVYEAKPATPKALAAIMSAGVQIERATETQQQPQQEG